MTPVDKLTTALIALRIGVGMAGHRLLGRTRGLADRLADIPLAGAKLTRPVTIHWNAQAIPFVEAETDEDAAFGLGVAHAHLRLGQMEIMRRLARGRLAEMLGPAAVDLDHGLRILGFDRALAPMMAMMPETTRRWATAFAAGISHYVRATPRLPPEFALLGLGRDPWSLEDILTIGRMAAADCNWFILFNLLKLRRRPDWPQLWSALADHEGAAFRALVDEDQGLLGGVATGFTRAGSNAVAVAGGRAASGASLMAADPHVSLMQPNLWLAAGVRSPSHHAVGLMLPGLPFVAIGRNPWIAWSGTALQSSSTDLFDAAGLPATVTRRDRLQVRWSGDAETVVRETPLGPLISDAAMLDTPEPVAMTWMGHRPSDDLTGWLKLSQARDWNGFVAAADAIAVPGQTLLYADAHGHVGKVIACQLPSRPPGRQADAVLPPAEHRHWRRLVSTRSLPQIYDPPGGIVASANEQPRHAEFRVGLFFSAHDRFLRLHRLLRGRVGLDLDQLAAIQRDVHSESAIDMKTWLSLQLDDHPLAHRLDQWDGHYHADSTGAVAYERLVGRLHHLVHGDSGQAAYWASWNPAALTRKRLGALDSAQLAAGLKAAANAVLAESDDGKQWGDIHRLRLAHVLGMLPGLSRLFRFTDIGVGGGNETLMKTAHGLAGPGRHGIRFGANARFLADCGDPDSARVVLLGGQDGWFGATNALDQVELWQRGETVALPLTPEGVRAEFGGRTVLE